MVYIDEKFICILCIVRHKTEHYNQPGHCFVNFILIQFFQNCLNIQCCEQNHDNVKHIFLLYTLLTLHSVQRSIISKM